jgi:hypothetical protein
VARELEYLEEALEEAAAAARWYAERSAAAAVGFSEKSTRPNPPSRSFRKHGRGSTMARGGTCCVVIPLASSTESNRAVFSLSQSRMGIDGLGTGSRECLANPRMEPTRRGSCAARLMRHVMPRLETPRQLESPRWRLVRLARGATAPQAPKPAASAASSNAPFWSPAHDCCFTVRTSWPTKRGPSCRGSCSSSRTRTRHHRIMRRFESGNRLFPRHRWKGVQELVEPTRARHRCGR